MTRGKIFTVAFLLMLLFSFTAGLADAALGGCVLNLQFNEGTGTTAYDASGYGNNGAITGASWTTGQYGSALSFDSNDQVSGTLSRTSTSISISVWLTGSQNTVNTSVLLNDNSYLAMWQSGYITFLPQGGTTWHSSNIGVSASPRHIVATYDGLTVKLYVNGTLTDSFSDSKGLGTITGYQLGNGMVGVQDELQIYNRALSASEIQTLYQGPQEVVVDVSGAEQLYMRSDLYSKYNVTGYGLDSANTASNTTVSLASVTDTIYYGFRVYLLNSAGYTEELTAGTPAATMSRTVDGAGAQTGTYTATLHRVAVGDQCLKINVYMRIGAAGDWTLKATFISNPLLATAVEASTWTFTLYTNLTGTDASFKFGSSTAPSGLSGLSLTEPDLWGMANYYMHTGNYFMFVLYPYTRLIGLSPFVSIILFGIGITVYARFRSMAFLLLILVMLSVGGFLNFIMGDAVMGLVAILCTFALAGLYWKVFR